MGNKAERHRAIQEIVRREEIGTQKELVERLRQLGFEVTQATVSRDIASGVFAALNSRSDAA